MLGCTNIGLLSPRIMRKVKTFRRQSTLGICVNVMDRVRGGWLNYSLGGPGGGAGAGRGRGGRLGDLGGEGGEGASQLGCHSGLSPHAGARL